MARILDPPGKVELRRYADLLAEWDGIAIGISSKRLPWTSRLNSRLIVSAVVLFVLLFALSIVRKVIGIRVNSPRRLLGSMATIVGLSVLIGNFYHLTSPIGLYRNRSACSLLFRYHYAVNLPRISLDEICAVLDQPSLHVIVDARPYEAFLRGHIPGAISIPIDGNPEQYSAALELIPRGSSVTVYCESRNCQWDEHVARHLHFAGVERVQLFEGGWRVWQESIQ